MDYQKDLDAIRSKRRQYREMLYDAMLERRKLMESMQIQKDEDDVLRKKVWPHSNYYIAKCLLRARFLLRVIRKPVTHCSLLSW